MKSQAALTQVVGSANFIHVAMISFLTAIAIAASLVFVIAIETRSSTEAPPEHDVKADLFEALEQPANGAAARSLSTD